MEPSTSTARPFKRRRVEDYPRGSVMRVEVFNFMTYKRAVVEPGAKLNLVLGPNGTGKSSLVCAICVGLAGKTTLLGRAEDVSSFVRRGADSGWVEITLSSGDPARPYVIRREMRRDTNSSDWYLNREKVRMKDVEELVRDRLKVQLDNLCQFLPQDKVVEFARLKPVDLLEATEKAIGNGELFDQHKQLVELRRELTEHDMGKAALEESVAHLKAENSRNTRDVENIQRRQQLMQEVELAAKRLPWVQFEVKRQAWEKDKEKREDAKRLLQQAQQAQQEEEGPLAERQQLMATLKAQKQRLDGQLRAADLKLLGGAARRGAEEQPGLEEQMNAAIEEVQNLQGEIRGLAQQAAARERKIAELESDVAELEGAVAALPPVGHTGQLGEQKAQLAREHHDVATQLSSYNMQLEELRGQLEAIGRQRKLAEDKLRRIDDSKMQRLQALESRNPGILGVWQWLQRNKDRFRGPVYGPIAVEVECPDQLHVCYLEQQVSANHWSFFVTQYREDQDLLRIECERLRYRPSISTYVGDPNRPIEHPRGEASEYARYGIIQTLDTVFTAPAIVKHVLCDEAGIHMTYVGDRNARVEDLFRDQDRVQAVYTPQSYFRQTRSAYNRAAVSTLVQDVRPARLLAGAATVDDGRERAAAQADIRRCDEEAEGVNAQGRELQEQRAAKQAHQDQLAAQMRQVDERIRATQAKHQELRTRLRSKQNELERLRRQADPRKKEPKLRQQLDRAGQRAFAKAMELAQVQASLADLLQASAAVDLALREVTMQVEKLSEAGKARQATLQRLQLSVNGLTELCKRSADEARRAKERAELEAPLTEELEAQWEAANGGQGLPVDEPGLRDLIDRKTAEADGVLVQNPAALQQYNTRLREIADQERQLAALEERRQLARQSIDDIKGTWLPELQRIVATINSAFSAAFPSVGCAGDVALHEAEGEDFEKYAIEIRVKFRDSEELQTLDANRQSGGERSVSTILYLIALQGVTVTPFRVVDEINQGMDPINERKVFMQLVDAACRPGTPQCFLLTPKLLPDLPFTRDVTVLQIMNGAHVTQVAAGFKMEKLLGSQRMALLAAA